MKTPQYASSTIEIQPLGSKVMKNLEKTTKIKKCVIQV